MFSSPVNDFGKLSINGKHIVDKNGNIVQLRGMSLFWSQWFPQFYNSNLINWLVDDWRVNIIRIPIGVEYGGYLTNPDTTLIELKTIVDAAIHKGIYVIIDWHDHNAIKHTKESKRFFNEVTQLYGNKPNIIYEIFNEPVKQSWDSIKLYSSEVINEIRKKDSSNIIVVGTPFFCQNVDDASKSPITGQENIAYSFHFYASDNWHQQKLRDKADAAIKNGMPLIVTEWGVGEANGNGNFNLERTEAWVKWLEDNKISWCNWSICDKPETCSALKTGANPNGNWTKEQLSKSGNYIRNKIRLLNSGIKNE
jgi:endoglucanase